MGCFQVIVPICCLLIGLIIRAAQKAARLLEPCSGRAAHHAGRAVAGAGAAPAAVSARSFACTAAKMISVIDSSVSRSSMRLRFGRRGNSEQLDQTSDYHSDALAG